MVQGTIIKTNTTSIAFSLSSFSSFGVEGCEGERAEGTEKNEHIKEMRKQEGTKQMEMK